MKKYKSVVWALYVVVGCVSIACKKDADTIDFGTQTLRLTYYTSITNASNAPLLEMNIDYLENGKMEEMDWGNPNINRSFRYDQEDKLILGGDFSYAYNSENKIEAITSVSKDTAMVYYSLAGAIDRIEYVHTQVFEGPIYYVQEFRYDNRKRVRQVINTRKREFEDEVTTKTLKYDDLGNVVKMEEVRGDEYSETTYNYDNKRNPYFDMLKATGFSENPSLIYLYSLPSLIAGNGCYFYSQNNLTSIETNHSHGKDSWTTNYTYNKDGYPIEAHTDYIRTNLNGEQESFFTETETWEYEANPFLE